MKESETLKDSYCDKLIKNMDEYRKMFNSNDSESQMQLFKGIFFSFQSLKYYFLLYLIFIYEMYIIYYFIIKY